MIFLPSSLSLIAPRALSCIVIFPRTEPSMGPATTFFPVYFAVLLGQAVVNRHGDLSQALRCALTVLLAVTDDFLHHIVGSGKSRVIRIDDKVFSCCLSGSPDDIREGNLSLEFTPVFPEVLHDPETVDVFQVADLALYAALVGVVVFEGLVGQNRLVQLHSHKGPGTAA